MKLAILANSRYALLKNESDLTDIQQDKLEEIKKRYPGLAMMHEQKELFRNIFEDSTNWVEGCLKIADWLAKAQSIF